MLQIKLKLLLYIQSTCLLLFIIYKNIDPPTLALSIVFLFYLLVFFLFIINIYKQMCTALD